MKDNKAFILTTQAGSFLFHSVTLDTGPLHWGGEVSIGDSPPGDASFWVLRLQVLVWSHSCPASLIQAFCFSLSPDRHFTEPMMCDFSWWETGCPLCETAPDGWIDGCVRSRAHWNNTVNWGSVFCSALFSWVHPFFCRLWNCFIYCWGVQHI